MTPPRMPSGAAACDWGADEHEVKASNAAGMSSPAARFNNLIFMGWLLWFLFYE